MEISLPVFLLVLGLAVLQLVVGVVLGRCLPGRHQMPAGESSEQGYFRHLAARLGQVVGSVAEDVKGHQVRIQEASRQLASVEPGDPDTMSRLVLTTITHVMEINEGLQARLSAAEEKLREQNAQIESHIAEARTDPLTRLPNRRAFDDELVARVACWQRRREPFGVIMIDVDHFKRLNDQYGHLAGDHVLRRLAEILGDAARPPDLVARVGGEEFGIILPDAPPSEARRLAEALREAVAREEFLFEDVRLERTISLGVASVQAADDPTSMVRRADEALYVAKRAGRNCTYFHNGVKCERVVPETRGDAQLQHICDQLRDRMADLAEGWR
jgi:diguanylate cyclase